MLFIILFGLSFVANIICGLVIFRALQTIEQLEEVIKQVENELKNTNNFFDSMQQRLMTTIETMRSIDIRGAFESDDEVGGIFHQMKSMILALDVYLVEEATSNAKTD